MKSIQDIIDNQGVEAYRSERERLKNALEELTTAYKASSSPAETLDNLGDIETVAIVIATMVNCSSRDGRISNTNKKWATTFGYNDADAVRMGITGDEIHRAHLDQLASAIQGRINAVIINEQRKSYGSSEEAPPVLKHAVRVAHRIMMEHKEKESEQNNQ